MTVPPLYDTLIGLPRRTKWGLVLALDLMLVPAALILSIVLRFDTADAADAIRAHAGVLVATCSLAAVVLHGIGIPRIRLHHTEARALTSLALGAALLTMIAAASAHILQAPAPRSLPLIFGTAFFTLAVGARLAILGALFATRRMSAGQTPVILYGAGTEGVQIAYALRSSGSLCPVAFVDDNRAFEGLRIAGLKVHGARMLPRLVARFGVKTVILALSSASDERRGRCALRSRSLRSALRATRRRSRRARIRYGVGRRRAGRPRPLRAVRLPQRGDGRPRVHGDPGRRVMRIVVTGAGGLIGRHARAHLHAANCAAAHRGAPEPWDVVALDHAAFQDDAQLRGALKGADAVLHFAGVNRAPEPEVEAANPVIAQRLVAACDAVGSDPHIVHANSTHAGRDTAYGRSKARAAEVLADGDTRMTDVILPHIFGEGARPFYNNVTATLIHQILDGTEPQLNPEGRVELLHAGAAADMAIKAITDGQTGRIAPEGRQITVAVLYDRLRMFHESYAANVIPDLSDPFDLQLFNTYRAAISLAARPLTRNTDPRGTLFEAVKGGGGGQTFLSTTKAGVTRGDHFHLDKVERFLVLAGEAVIRLRHVLSDEVQEIRVSGTEPVAVDMPTLTTHSIENTGADEVLTLFWSHALFDPAAPDTYADRVMP